MTRDDSAAFAPPPAFGPFRVLHQIGIGALGPVFRTYEPTRDRLVAVKLFRLDITPEQAQALADELAHACDAGLFHPSIVEPIAAGVQGTAAYRAEEYVAAESLDVAIRHYAPAPLDKVLPFITQLAGAVDFARTAGVGHGALHLRDVFVTPDEARASGFGIVESLERVGIRAPVRRPYSAPERIAGAAWSTPADVFSLAAIAYELLTGRRPSGTGDQIGVLTEEHVGEHAAAVRQVLARAMDDAPERRYPAGLAFASALEAAAGGRGVVAAASVVAAIPAVETPRQEAVAPGPDAMPLAAAAADESALHVADAVHAPVEELTLAEVDSEIEHAVEVPAPIEVAPALHAERHETVQDTPAPTLFEAADDEPLDNLSINEPPRSPASPMWQYEPEAKPAGRHTHEELIEPERPRIAMLPVALGTILGLLIGFAGGYAVAGRNGAAPADSRVAAAPPQTPAPSQSATPPQRSGRAWSEQSVAQQPRPSTDVPPVPGDAPAGGAETRRGASAGASANAGGRPRTDTSRMPAVPTAVTRGSIRVESSPKNAVVTVNGQWRGRTPVTIDNLPFGTHTIRVVQSGYSVARQSVTLSKSQPSRTLSLQLQRPSLPAAAAAKPGAPATRDAFSGSLFVASNPPGARIYIDGRPMGTAPARIPEVGIGSHVVRLELPDHRVWTTSTRVAAGQETRVTGSLERIQ